MRNYCTYFDSTFIVRGLTLYRSLVEESAAFNLWVLCLDEMTFDTLTLLDAPGLLPIRLAELESAYPELQNVKAHSGRADYFFYYLPSLPAYILEREPAIRTITFLDADLYFFSDPDTILNEMTGNSVLILEHRFPSALQNIRKFGRFKIGFLGFRNDEGGRGFLENWRSQWKDWCTLRVRDEKCADQAYLDEWPARFNGANMVQHLGANVSPWNVGRYDVQHASDRVTVNGIELIFYHFHQLRILNRWLCDPGLVHFQKTPATRELREWVYKPYLRALSDTWDWMGDHTDGLNPGYVQVQPGRYTFGNLFQDTLRSFIRGQLLVSMRGFR